MKKIIISGMMSLLMTANVFAAAPEVVLKDAEKNMVTVQGDAEKGKSVSLFVLNPDFDLEDIAKPGAVQYYDRIFAGESGYAFDVIIRNVDKGGMFTAVVNAGGEQEETPFSFYPLSVKLNYIGDINGSTTYAELVSKVQSRDGADADAIKNIYAAYSMENDVLFAGLTREQIGNALLSLKQYDATGSFQVDAESMRVTLKKALVLAGINAGKQDLLLKDGNILYSDVIGLNTKQEYTDYLAELSQAGRNALHGKLLSKQYKTLTEVVTAFCEEIPYHVIVNYKQSGWGHISGFLSQYDSYYRAKGFLLDKMGSISNPADFYSDLLDANAPDITRLKDVFNGLFGEGGGSSPGAGGGMGGGFGGTAGGGISGESNNVSSTPNEGLSELPPSIDKIFLDVADVEWAHEAIAALRDCGAVNGKSETSFAPNDSVTRAEFLKMMMIALSFEADNEELSFSDVTDAWAKPYIATAVKQGIANGVSETSFAPNDAVTREQGVTFLYRAGKKQLLEFTGVSKVFMDEPQISDYAKEAIYKLSAAGIVSGIGSDIFAPKDLMTRAEAAKVIYGVMQMLETK